MRWENLNNRIPRVAGLCYHTLPMRFEILRAIPKSDAFTLVYQSPLVYNTQHPVNQPQVIAMQVLCNSDYTRRIKFSAVSAKGHEINSVVTTVNSLLEHKILSGKVGSKFALQSFELFEKPTIIDYLRSGWSVSLVIAVDFTASNGDPKTEYSNHTLVKEEMNDYEKVLFDIGTVIEMENLDSPASVG